MGFWRADEKRKLQARLISELGYAVDFGHGPFISEAFKAPGGVSAIRKAESDGANLTLSWLMPAGRKDIQTSFPLAWKIYAVRIRPLPHSPRTLETAPLQNYRLESPGGPETVRSTPSAAPLMQVERSTPAPAAVARVCES